MIVSGVKDYRVAYKSYQDWLLPRYAVLSVFCVGLVFIIVGIILVLVGQGSGFAAAGAVFLGLGVSLLAICFLLCLHAYCVRYIRDQSTQTKDAETQVKEAVAPSYAVVTTKPPQGVLKSGRSPSTEPKRVRLQAEKDTGFSSGQTQSLSSQFLTEKFPLRTPELKEEEQKSQSQVIKTSSITESSQATENHYETLPLKVETDLATTRRLGEVFSRSQEADVSTQLSSTHVVYPQQATVHQVTRFAPPPPPSYPPPSTNLSSSSSSWAYRSDSPSFSRDYSGQPPILTSPHPLAAGPYRQSSEQHFQASSQARSGGNIQHFHAPTQARAASSVQHYQVTSDSRPIKIEQYYNTSPPPMTAHQRQMTSEYHWADMGSYNPAFASRAAGQDMSFEDHRSSKMSLYDNLNGWTDGGATI